MSEETAEKKTTTRKAAAVTTKKPATLVEALAEFQKDIPAVTLDGANPHFKSKFATLANISNIILPRLSELGLTYTTASRVNDEGKMKVVAKLKHVSGEEETAEFPVTQTDPQKIGSAVTYFRRYGLAALTGLVADGDDDGNTASAPEPKAIQNVRKAAAPAGKAAGTSDLQGKIRAWIGSDDARRTQVNEGVSKAKASGATGEDAFKAVIAELGIE